MFQFDDGPVSSNFRQFVILGGLAHRGGGTTARRQ
jgi:hypothetical protein